MKRTILSIVVTLIATATAVVSGSSPAAAYCTTPSGWVVSKWTGTPRITMWQTSSIADSWLDELQNSSAQWRGIASSNWSVSTVAKNWQGPVLHKGNWYMASSAPGGFGGAPGITQLSFQPRAGGTISWANIYLDSTWAWNGSGTMNQSRKQADMRTVATHELGHLLMLHHPWACGAMTTAEKNAVMNAEWKKKWTINSDDKAGAAAMY